MDLTTRCDLHWHYVVLQRSKLIAVDLLLGSDQQTLKVKLGAMQHQQRVPLWKVLD